MIPLRDHNPSGSFPLITIGLIFANLYAFYLELTSPDPEAFFALYSFIPGNIDFNNYATLTPFITSMFLHAGWLHLISNMWFLWIFGDNVEDKLGKIRYLLLYFAAGIVAALAQYYVDVHTLIPMVGASGAVAGILGAYFVFFPGHRVDTIVPIFFFIQIVALPAFIMLGFWLTIQLFAGFGALSSIEEGGIAFFAHIGGFLAGMLYASIRK